LEAKINQTRIHLLRMITLLGPIRKLLKRNQRGKIFYLIHLKKNWVIKALKRRKRYNIQILIIILIMILEKINLWIKLNNSSKTVKNKIHINH